jgi:hypothetical protein
MLLTFNQPGAAFAQATTETTHEFIPLFQFTFVPCADGGAGEFVLITGTLHVLSHVTINSSRRNINQQILPLRATGMGQTTGDVYRSTGGGRFHDTFPTFPPTNGAAEFTSVNNFKLIGPGPDNNLLIFQTIHRTINANGEVTSEVINTSTECR